jgi:adenine-specific DNA-methyltransferase
MDDYVGKCVYLDTEARNPINQSTQRGLGAYYTCPNTAEHMAAWAMRRPGMRILEPSFGSGIFLRAAKRIANRRFGDDVTIIGAELSPEEYERAKESLNTTRDTAHLGDFLAMPLTKVDAVIGNPPYVRLRHLPKEQAHAANTVAARALGHPMDASGSIWMPFVLRCMEFLNKGGRMALVLPFELTYVKYARPLWRKLSESFSHLTVVRVRERIFPEILQDVVILYADGFSGETSKVEFCAYETISELLSESRGKRSTLSAGSLIEGNRDFIRAHLDSGLQQLLDTKLHDSTESLSGHCTFNIGYVSGHKEFFHPSPATQAEWSLPPRSLTTALVSGRAMKGAGLLTSQIEKNRIGKLFLPSTKLTRAEKAYIQHGEEQGVNLGYKCRIRSPWYIVPGVRVPDLMLSVFAEKPVLMNNDAGVVATNSLLAGFLKNGCSAESFITAWYSSLTLLGCEMQVHSLGGGVLVLIPGEVAKVRIPRNIRASSSHLRKLNSALIKGDLQLAYEVGDDFVLKKALGLSASEIDLVRNGVARLRHWRTTTSD